MKNFLSKTLIVLGIILLLVALVPTYPIWGAFLPFHKVPDYISNAPDPANLQASCTDGGAVELYIQKTKTLEGQAWTALKDYTLTEVEVYVRKVGSPGNLVLDVYYTDVFGRPFGEVLTTATVLSSDIPTSASWITFDVEDIELEKGDLYAFALYTTAGAKLNKYALSYVKVGSYKSGFLIYSTQRGSNWKVMQNADLIFKVYGTPLEYGIEVSDNLVPGDDNTYSIGATDRMWKDAYFGGTVTADGITAPTGRDATYVVAASDAPAHVKAQADYLCGDGTYSTDDQYIQAAIDALPAGRVSKATVKCTGSFGLSANLTLASYTILDLTQAKLSLANNVDDSILYISNKTQIDIIGGTLEGNKANQTSGHGVYILTATSTNIRILGTTIQNCKQRGVYITDATDVVVEGCRITGSGDRHVYIIRGGRVKVIGNYLADNDANQAISSNASAGSNYSLEIKDNIISNAYTNGILFDGNKSFYDIVISNNLILTTGAAGIWATAGNLDGGETISRFIISNNILKNTGLSARSANLDGILFGTATDILIANNVVYRPSADCIATLKMSNSSIVGNTLVEAGYESGAGQGMMVLEGDHLTIQGNTIRLSKQDGIRLGGVSYSIVSGNVVENSSQATTNTWRDIALIVSSGINSTYNIVSGNNLVAQETNKVKYNIAESDTNQDYNDYFNNNLVGALTAPVNIQGANSKVQRNRGYITENSGTAIIADDATSVKVTHGLAAVPTRVIVTPTSDIGAATKFWISSKDSDSDGQKFTISVDIDPDANITFDWRAIVGEGN